MRRFASLLLIGLVCICFLQVAALADGIVNGDFESGDTGWNYLGGERTSDYVGYGVGYESTWGAYIGASSGTSTINGIYQDVPIGVGDVFSFLYNGADVYTSGFPSSYNDEFKAYLQNDGHQLALLDVKYSGTTTGSWTTFTSSALTADQVASLGYLGQYGNTGQLHFTVLQDGSTPYLSVKLDNVDRTAGAPPTPELGSFVLLGLSLMPVAGVDLRRRRVAA